MYDKNGKISSTIKPDENFVTIPISQISKIIKYCIDEVNVEKKCIKPNTPIDPKQKTKPVIKDLLNIQSPIKKWLQQVKKRWQ